jgi:Toastrack DUF4097
VTRARLLAGVVAWLAAAPALAQPAKPHAAPAAPQAVDERSRLEVQPSGPAFKQLVIENPLGDVRVEGYDGTAIMIETHKHAPDPDTLDRLRVSLVPNPDGTVRITTTADGGREVRPVPRSAVRIDLIIRAPRDAHVDAAVSAGNLELENLDAGGELDSASGSISIKNVSGELVTHTVSGPTTLAQVFGSVDAATVSSDLELDTIGGEKLIASASKGRIAGRRVRSRDVELTTTDGKIVLEAEASLRGHLVVSSLRGDVDVRVRRHGVLVVRGRGTKVDLGAQQPIEHVGGWSQATLGHGTGPAAMVELQSRYGMVQFAIVE